jgi:2-haloacid dehalogenase
MIAVAVFDAYGTLFDVDAAARQAAGEPGGERLAETWPALSADWRRKQLEYTWLRSLMQRHADFETVTAEALDWAMEANGLAGEALRARLMALYRTLPAYPEVPSMLEQLREGGVRCAILSNGSPGMLDAAVEAAGIGDALEAVLSVEKVGIFKPAPVVYGLVETALGVEPDEVLFVSANGWDAAGAAAFGFRTVWVNRGGAPVDRLPARPEHVVATLAPVPDIALAA